MARLHQPVAIAATAALFSTLLLAETGYSEMPSPNRGPQDPGVRRGPAGAGGALPGLGTDEQNYFNAAAGRFQAVDSVSGTVNDAPTGTLNGIGLGPRFNMNSGSGCHAQPAVGGTSPFIKPQITVATLRGAANSIPPFISLRGPVREARFIRNPDNTPDGSVHALFVISGRSDAPGCNITQPDFAQAMRQGNLALRIPTPLFGTGQIENTPDINLVSDFAAVSSQARAAGISGSFNRSGNDGTIMRFGWKAQNKSLLMFSGEAYNVEMGATNELFPNEREDDPSCQFNRHPEDATNLADSGISNSAGSNYSSDIVNFAAFMRMSAGPRPAAATDTTRRGEQAFNNVGCNLCQIKNHTTGPSIFTNQGNVQYAPFSDFALHDMGAGLTDQITRGQADSDQFRTAPLWGVGQRIFFLHDGRTDDLLQAIRAHAGTASEANTVIGNFNALPASSQQDILNFLRSL